MEISGPKRTLPLDLHITACSLALHRHVCCHTTKSPLHSNQWGLAYELTHVTLDTLHTVSTCARRKVTQYDTWHTYNALLKALVVLHGLVSLDNGVNKVIGEHKWYTLSLHTKLALKVAQKVSKVNVQQLQQLNMTPSQGKEHNSTSCRAPWQNM